MSGSDKGTGRISRLPRDIEESNLITFAAFLESVPPAAERKISNLCSSHRTGTPTGLGWHLSSPDIRLHCPTTTCNGLRTFKCDRVNPGEWVGRRNVFFTYICRNCEEFLKTYALQVERDNAGHDSTGSAVKFGEIPSFGPPLPPRLSKMFGQNRELFRKGWRAEKQGLGIGSFVYYRRVVELQKDHILEEFRKAAVRLAADEDLLSSIDRAKNETRFTEAIDLVKDAIPDGLKMKGHNPLKLLHRSLSKGVHDLSDKQCLDQAQAVRVILNELIGNMVRITSEKREIDAALGKLLQ